MNRQGGDDGFSLVELLIVIVILGVLATVVVFAVFGMTDDAEATGCEADARSLATAYERYRAEFSVDTVPAADLTPDGVENTLIGVGYIKAISTLNDIDGAGIISAATGAPC